MGVDITCTTIRTMLDQLFSPIYMRGGAWKGLCIYSSTLLRGFTEQ